MKRYENQVAAITGGATGLGKAIAQRFAEEGAKLALIDFNDELLEKTKAEFEAAGYEVLTCQGDISSEASVNAAFDKIEATYGQLDVMVNSAGIVGPTKINFADVDLADFEKVNAVNLTGSFLTAKAAVKIMEKRNYGRILLIASIAGKEGNAGMTCYSTSKAGVIGLVKAAGKEYAETGITINGLAPAVIRTAFIETIPDDQVKYMTDKIPMKRCGTLDEVTGICAYICSPEAAFNTGYTFDISGGRATY
ncbi:oxidoreductase, short chain dehydrogenase/reductase family protein [Lentisphaera araneosa HTCC2155]|uniref:Oxidoreductase, short chain dehydrogenase/reductase family protein n=1 Tax=Lentisphaera araneosa HTCC2155 TaxID=313628 RepID=A6DLZ0_9BACT|nr:SDR family NAD(P)-dependent oxidoreductase [Lentisphaera araneosa]EDM27288.1 oxidoreductase, short chain dehydrogenase/reductase family protein [Lentisphaera araneosa HTCC2155]